MIAVVVSVIMLVPMFGIEDVNSLIKWFIKLNSVCSPMRYLWVFAAYFSLKRFFPHIKSEYKFVRNQYLGMFIGGWCFIITACACVAGMYSASVFQMGVNIVTPFFLFGLGLILPQIAKHEANISPR